MSEWVDGRRYSRGVTRSLRQIRNHRRPPGTLIVTVEFVVAGILFCGALAAFRMVLGLGERELIRDIGLLPAIGLGVAVAAGALAVIRFRVLAARRALDRWDAQAGWSPVTGRTEWPWPDPGAVTVRTALGSVAQGHPVVVGELSWTSDGLRGSTDRSAGTGQFAIVRLPREYPSASVHRRRQAPRERAGEDEFIRQFRVVLDDMSLGGRLTDPALHEAHVAGRIPPWTLEGDEIYTVVATGRPLRPAAVADLTARMVLLVELLDLGGTPA